MSRWFRWLVCGVVCTCTAWAEDPPQASFVLKRFRPVQAGVELETPEPAEVAKCTVKVDQRKGSTGWMVLGPEGQVLRRFLDTNGDNVVDQWRYYKQGVEVYRDVDSNFNSKVDQSRWLNTGGSRWGLDTNEDGRIDAWRMISAEEVSRLAVDALVRRDISLLQTILITPRDIAALEIEAAIAAKLTAAVANPRQKLQKAGTLGAKTRWVRFDCTQPGLVPSDDGKARKDLVVYEGALAIVDTAGNSGLVELGEMVQVGTTWKLTSIPRPLGGETVQVAARGLLLQPTIASLTAAAPGVSPQMQKLLDQLRQLDSTAPDASTPAAAIGRYHSSRTDVLAQLAVNAPTAKDRDQWSRQLVDSLTALAQSGAWPGALARLAAEESRWKTQAPTSPFIAFINYRHLLARYSQSLRVATDEAGQAQAQRQWLSGLGQFIQDNPQAEDTPEAMWHLGTAQEFASGNKQAQAWYTQLVRKFPRSPAGLRAAGALKRLALKGKPLSLVGRGLKGPAIRSESYRGKVLLVVYWATWCKPCTAELPTLFRQYRTRGFEVIGVNLDQDRTPVSGYLTQHRVTWPQLHEPGGLDSRPAREFGILSLPTMFLVDRQGTVVNAAATLDDLKTELPKLLGITTTTGSP